MKCDEIQDILFDYMTRELGPAQSELVREHLRKCDRCRAAAAELQATLAALRDAARDRAGIPEHLSEKRRRRVRRALVHPVIAWLERHHAAVSIGVAVLVILIVFVYSRAKTAWSYRVPPGIPVKVLERGTEGSRDE
ncbi:MAG: zf-HC2 domain-containing protein [Lentisphaerae bacterium]|nr:zf-HC2 domain-containing protein [Lentisphaerota bacterium]